MRRKELLQMKQFSENFTKYFWFIGGFTIGIMLISLGHAALPKKAIPQTAPAPAKAPATLSEMKVSHGAAPELDQDFARLTTVEGQYAESIDQQRKLRSATSKVANASNPSQKKKR